MKVALLSPFPCLVRGRNLPFMMPPVAAVASLAPGRASNVDAINAQTIEAIELPPVHRNHTDCRERADLLRLGTDWHTFLIFFALIISCLRKPSATVS